MLSSTPFLFYLVAGVALIAAELLIFQLSVFWFLFVGLGALATALAAWFLPEAGWLFTTGFFVVSSLVISLALYKPLKKWQKKPSPIPGHDAIGKSVEVVTDISKEKHGEVIWSGTDWRAELDPSSEPLVSGDTGVITGMEGIVLTVRKK